MRSSSLAISLLVNPLGNMRLIPLIFGDLYCCAVAEGLLPSSQSEFIEHEGVFAMKEWGYTCMR